MKLFYFVLLSAILPLSLYISAPMVAVTGSVSLGLFYGLGLPTLLLYTIDKF